MELLKGELKKKKYNEEEKKKFKDALGNLKSDINRNERFKNKLEIKRDFKKKILEDVKQGKKAFFPKKSN